MLRQYFKQRPRPTTTWSWCRAINQKEGRRKRIYRRHTHILTERHIFPPRCAVYQVLHTNVRLKWDVTTWCGITKGKFLCRTVFFRGFLVYLDVETRLEWYTISVRYLWYSVQHVFAEFPVYLYCLIHLTLYFVFKYYPNRNHVNNNNFYMTPF